MLLRLAEAEEDLIAIWLHIAANSERAADRLLDRFEAQWDLIETQPRMGAPRHDILPGLRHLVQGEYLSFYRLNGDDIEILRVPHGRRDITGDDFPE